MNTTSRLFCEDIISDPTPEDVAINSARGKAGKLAMVLDDRRELANLAGFGEDAATYEYAAKVVAKAGA